MRAFHDPPTDRKAHSLNVLARSCRVSSPSIALLLIIPEMIHGRNAKGIMLCSTNQPEW